MRSSTTGVRGALTVWSARQPRTLGDVAYAVYVLVLTLGILGGPGLRAAWLAATGARGRDLLAGPELPALCAGVTGLAWAAALVMGQERGPALRPPFLAATLAASSISRLRAFGGPIARATAFLVLAGAGAVLLPGAALVAQGLATGGDVVGLVGAGALAGLVTAGAWLAGQVLRPGIAGAAALVVGAGAVVSASGSAWASLPWGIVGAAWPGVATSATSATPVTTASLTGGVVLGLAATVWLVAGPGWLGAQRIVGQAVRGQRAQTLVTAMDLAAFGELYRAVPRTGRRWRAVGAAPGPGAVVVADVVGSARTPVRLLAGLMTLVAAGAVSGVAMPGLVGSGAALTGSALPVGVVLVAALAYAGASVLCDGVRHAAASRGGLAQHGYPDAIMLALHTLWPLVGGCGAALLGWSLVNRDALPAGPLVAEARVALSIVLAVVVGAIGVRVADALKGPMPVELLVPLVTPAGDVSAIGRLMWLSDGPLLVAVLGAAGAATAGGLGAHWLVAVLGVEAVVVLVRAARR
ncbi:hypothetical protein ACTVCO_11720 [Sanguibacter sp. A247]|uniref:hypothetical protein n=1 Tax=unclassified Sanguibacter TaxID=2645534 RepID=UPI003FD77FDE